MIRTINLSNIDQFYVVGDGSPTAKNQMQAYGKKLLNNDGSWAFYKRDYYWIEKTKHIGNTDSSCTNAIKSKTQITVEQWIAILNSFMDGHFELVLDVSGNVHSLVTEQDYTVFN